MVDTNQVSGIPFALVIPAAGSGVRAGGAVPKPFQEFSGRSILEHSVYRFIDLPGLQQIIIATSGPWMDRVRERFSDVGRRIDLHVIEGGKERQQSVYQALKHVSKEQQLVAIHDAVRPFVDPDHIQECLDRAQETGAAILGFPVRDTLKKVGKDGRVVNTPDRSLYWAAQTPQIFHRTIIQDAYRIADENGWVATDDASLVEKLEKPVWMVRGSNENFKITWPRDFQLARLLLRDQFEF